MHETESLAETGRQLKAHADSNIRIGDPTPSRSDKLCYRRVEFSTGGVFDVALERIGVDPANNLSVYVVFISGVRCASDAQCAAICQSIFADGWKEPHVPSVTPPGCRWFIRVRREPYTVPN